jgi:hypothetical protein
MHGAAWIAWRQGDLEAGKKVAEESLQRSRELGDPQLIARSLRILGVCVGLGMGEDSQRAVALLEESARLSEAAGDLVGLAAVLSNLALSQRNPVTTAVRPRGSSAPCPSRGK